jgi:hypothetical protein
VIGLSPDRNQWGKIWNFKKDLYVLSFRYQLNLFIRHRLQFLNRVTFYLRGGAITCFQRSGIVTYLYVKCIILYWLDIYLTHGEVFKYSDSSKTGCWNNMVCAICLLKINITQMTPLSRIALVIEGALIICSNIVSTEHILKPTESGWIYHAIRSGGPAGPAGPVSPLLQPVILVRITARSKLFEIFILNYLIYEWMNGKTRI